MHDAVKIAGYLAAFAAGLVSVGTAWTMFDLPVLATRSYVDAREIKANEVRSEIVLAVIDLARDHRERIKRARDTLVERLAAATDAQVKVDLHLLIDQANVDITDVASRIMTLEKLLIKSSYEQPK